ncbi:hypothetical protein P12x_004556 [Tundrisphaera lichenicola]|uniref:hypothetical protein n=1 Tax=Tundrisphaera lichenicola TaxID=2029860 RepID=UPI003EB88125
MGLLKFRIPSPLPEPRVVDLRKSYVTGLDRTPSRLNVEIRKDLLVCQRGTTESGRLFSPWPIEGFGTPFVGTATLGERPEPYPLAIELARGRLNDVRNQLADWKQMGLRISPELEALMSDALRAFTKAATGRDDPATSLASAQSSLVLASEASQALIEAYVGQVLQNRLTTGKLPTQLAISLEGDPATAPWSSKIGTAFNAAQLQCNWKTLAPTEGKHRYEELDAQLVWATRQKLVVQAGPLIDLRSGALPDWIWLWSGDFDAVLGMAIDVVRQTVARYRGKIPVWHLVNRPGSTDILGMSEEDQIRLTARLLQVARQADPAAQFLVGLDRPWAEWMASSSFQLGPLHLGDYLARAELGMAGIALEIAPGYSSPGSHMRDLLDFSRLLDLYALLNFPMYLTFAIPSATGPDPQAESSAQVEKDQWPAPPTEASQAAIAARWIALAVAKPFVRSVAWRQLDDSAPHLYPHAGLIRPDKTPKPLLDWIKSFRSDVLN